MACGLWLALAQWRCSPRSGQTSAVKSVVSGVISFSNAVVDRRAAFNQYQRSDQSRCYRPISPPRRFGNLIRSPSRTEQVPRSLHHTCTALLLSSCEQVSAMPSSSSPAPAMSRQAKDVADAVAEPTAHNYSHASTMMLTSDKSSYTPTRHDTTPPHPPTASSHLTSATSCRVVLCCLLRARPDAAAAVQ